MVPLVSIIIVNFRAYQELGACLQTLQPDVVAGLCEVTVVDNATCSPLFVPLVERYSWIRAISLPTNVGFAAANNLGAKDALGDYLLFLNPDTTVTAGAVGTLATYLTEHQDAGIAGGAVYYPDGRLQICGRGFPDLLTPFFGRRARLTRLWPRNPISRRNLMVDEATRAPTDVDWVPGLCLMIRSDLYRSLDGMDERFFLYWEDADLCLRMHEAGWRCVYVPAAVICHACARSTAHAPLFATIAFHRNAYVYLRKHRRGIGRPPTLALAATGALALIAVRILAFAVRNMVGRFRMWLGNARTT